MKKIVQTVEVQGQGLEALLGEQVIFFCLNYNYYGKLIGVNTDDVLLEKAYVVYETGTFSEKTFKDAQLIANEWRLRTSTIESYGVCAQTTK